MKLYLKMHKEGNGDQEKKKKSDSEWCKTSQKHK